MTRFAAEDGAFEIDSLLSQCQVAICHGFYIKPDSRGQGWLKLTDFYSERQDEDVEIWGHQP